MKVTEVPGRTATLELSVRTGASSAPNVVGILEGSDPELKEQYVVFSAHMDHVGMGTPDERGDSIFNGADDDASGSAGVLEIAEAVASLATPPRRSTIFLWVSGEEKGLWGSAYYAEHPSVPVDRLVADLNMDMIGRNWPDTIVAIGKEHSDLGETLNRVNRAHPELGMTAIDDIWPEQNFYQRSDHFNFARRGVPILFFFNGTHPDYHGRDDEPDRIDADKASRISKLVFFLGMDVAARTEPPRWNPESYKRIVTQGR
jgi:Zn-dependent M28 family amino/carboxypeptidase